MNIVWKSLRRLRRCGRGQALVEFAFVFPMLLIMVIMMVEFARAWMHYQLITDAAREGARGAVIADQTVTSDDIIARITERLNVGGIQTSDADIDPDNCAGPTGDATVVQIYGCGWLDTRGEPASVTIRSPFRVAYLGGLLNLATGSDRFTISTSFVMRNE